MIVFVQFGSDHQLPRAVIDAAHRIGSVPQQVYDYLLKLDPATADRRKPVGELGVQHHPVSLKIAGRQCNHLSRSLVQINWFDRWGPFAEKRAQSCNHVRRTIAVADGAARGFLRDLDVWRVGRQSG
ncbi:hypothetical protein NKJ95_23965 [Mesorhizobium sp. M0012]|uniref:hypothetical protein n=1 Tax=Mesorhizobium sp. M0012 TaxID=2956840 RepID=UPI00333D9347